MASRSSLWPTDLRPSSIQTAEGILRQQADELERQTAGLLQGRVEVGSQAGWVTISFFIVAPRLDDYAYRLFKVRHKVPDPFKPLELIVASADIRRISSRSEFERELADVLGSAATRSILTQLLSLSEDMSASHAG